MKHNQIFAVIAAATVLGLASCNANKADNNEATETEVTETTVEAPEATAEEADPAPASFTLSDAQRKALTDAKLVSDDAFAKPVFLDFNATWCGPCREFGPYFEAAAEKYKNVATFAAIDVDNYGEVANAFGIQAIPAMIAIVPGGNAVMYVGTDGLVGEGAFDSIVEGMLM